MDVLNYLVTLQHLGRAGSTVQGVCEAISLSLSVLMMSLIFCLFFFLTIWGRKGLFILKTVIPQGHPTPRLRKDSPEQCLSHEANCSRAQLSPGSRSYTLATSSRTRSPHIQESVNIYQSSQLQVWSLCFAYDTQKRR